MNRAYALAQPAPAGWIPKPGDRVYLPRIRGRVTTRIRTGLVVVVWAPYVKVSIIWRGREVKERLTLRIDQIRPCTTRQPAFREKDRSRPESLSLEL